MKSSLSRLGVILIILWLIIFGYGYPMVNIANAQCAWVLWRYIDSKNIKGWEIVGGFPNYDSCLKDLNEKRERLRVLGSKGNQKSEVDIDGNLLWTYPNGDLTIQTWKCLPDTIDPRK